MVGATFPPSSNIIIAKVDVDVEKELGERFGIKGFPTLKFFKAGKNEPEDYTLGRNAEEIVAYVNQQADTAFMVKKPHSEVIILNPDNFDAIVKNPDHIVLGT